MIAGPRMSLRTLAFLCFFLSGSTGLMYEVVWTRLLGSVIGNTHFSITVVVAVFMGGLALGSYVGGRIADRTRNPLRLYGLLVLCVGLGCLLVPVAVHAARPLFGILYASYDGVPEAAPLLVVRLLFSAVVLLVPTSFMGATLPALSRHLARNLEGVGGTIGKLYTINTLGAVAGTFFTGFFGIPALGIWGSTALAVGIDMVIGAVVLVAARGGAPEAGAGAGSARGAASPGLAGSAPVQLISPGLVRLSLIAFGGVGFADMLLQIAWTKAIVLSIGNSTYAFSLIVTLFILGIAIGGGVVSLFVDRVKNLPLLLGVLIFFTALLVSATIPLLGDYPVLAARWFDSIREPSYPRFLKVHVLLVSAVILPSTIFMGTVFPIVGKIRTVAVESVGSAVGSAYFWNTLGSILGTLVAGFVLIPILGRVYWTLYVGAAISLALSLLLVLRAAPGPFPARTAIAGVLAAMILVPHAFLLPYGVLGSKRHFWHPSLLSRGAYVYYKGTYYDKKGNVIPRQSCIDGLIEQNEVLLYREGIHAPVAVVRNKLGEMAMRISGKVEASLAPGGGYNTDLPHQVLAGHLPMILHPAPKDVLTLGLGGGVTLGALTLYPIDSVDSLEISPEVIEAARDFFGKANHGALVNPKVRNVVGDGRNHLEYTLRSYDVITSVPSNPWIAGIGNLFTVEFFRTCRARLRPGGLICNWIHKINMRAEDFKTVVRTFIEVFGDHAQLWDLGYDALLVGGVDPIRFQPNRLTEVLKSPEIAGELAALGIDAPERLLRHYQFDARALRAYADSADPRPLNTDAFPVLEFSCPYGLYGHSFDAYESLAFAEHAELDPAWIDTADTGLLARASSRQKALVLQEKAELRLVRNLELQSEIIAKRNAGGATDAALVEMFRRSAAELIADLKSLEQATQNGADPWLRDRANGTAAEAMAVQPPGKTLTATLCAGLLLAAKESAGDPAQRLSYLEDATRYAGEDAGAAVRLAQMWLELNQPARGIPALEAVLAKDAKNAVVDQTLGVLLAASGRLAPGLEALQRALGHASEPALRSEIHQNIGFALQRSGRLEEAAGEYEKAIAENPANSDARARLANLRK